MLGIDLWNGYNSLMLLVLLVGLMAKLSDSVDYGNGLGHKTKGSIPDK